MFKRIVLVAAIVVPAFAIASGANAQGSSVPAAKTSTTSTAPASTTVNKSGKRGAFDRLDVNHDGKLTREEAKDSKRITSRFDALDTNKDGFLSRDEVRAMAPKRTGTPNKPAA